MQKEAIFSSLAITDDYFQKNKLSEKDFHPIAITSEKKISGWSSAVEKLTVGTLKIATLKVKKPIFLKTFDNDTAPSIQGVCVERENSATIYVNGKLNFCWRRFIAAKELSHLLMNKVDGDLRINELPKVLELFSFLVSRSPVETNAQLSEYMAYLGAMELLIPKAYVLNGLLEQDSKKIAEQIKCPVQVIEYRKDNHHIFDTIYDDSRSKYASIISKLNQ